MRIRHPVPRSHRTTRFLITFAAAVAVTVPIAAGGPAAARTAGTTTTPDVISGRLLAFNDFHGAIDPPTGSGGVVNGIPAGGSEYLAHLVRALRAEAKQTTPYVFTLAAGDNVGASPLVSAAFHDEPAIEVLNSLGLDFTSVGNHEFDEGVTELRRLQFGGCHPVDGCQDGDGFAGAKFPILTANVVDKRFRLPILLPLGIKLVGNVPVAFVGMTLEGTPSIVNPAGIANVEFLDEITTANAYADVLKRLGIRSLVLVIHEGGVQNPPPIPSDINGCANFSGAITNIVAGLRPEYGVVVTGHTHRFYNCSLPNSSGANSIVTSAATNGQMVTEIKFSVSKTTKRFVSAEARNVVAENGIRAADGSFLRGPDGNFVRNPALVDPAVKAIADKYRTAIAPISNRVIGSISSDITRDALPNGESPLGDVIADAQLRYTQGLGAQIALMNPGGIRAPLTFNNSPGGEAPGQVTFGEAFTVQPFNNLVVTQTFTGAQLKDVLEQQFVGFGGRTLLNVILQPSAGFTYTYNTTAAAGQRVSNMALNGTPIDPAATYRVTTNDFLANGGDGFTNLTAGTDRQTAPAFDVDALVAYLATGPIAPGPANRITRIG